ncbi:MAG: SPASM domain-containing protein [Chromatiales bacterium]|nr:SPASM domain-containing protein [Chromatiales bacterium]
MTDLFKVILIETHNHCNRTCWFCKFGQERQDAEHARMSMETIELIIQNLKELGYDGRVSWFFINEPLLDKRIFDIVERTRASLPKAFISLVTNGDLLTAEIYGKLRQKGLDALGVSIYDQDVFRKMQGFSNDGRLALMDRRAAPNVNQAGNVKQPAQSFDEDVLRFSGSTCMRPFRMMVVNAQGKVALCCSDLYTDVEMGDVHADRLEHIWRNEKFQRYRETLSANGRRGLALCESCSHSGRASPVFYPLSVMPRRRSNLDAVKSAFSIQRRNPDEK